MTRKFSMMYLDFMLYYTLDSKLILLSDEQFFSPKRIFLLGRKYSLEQETIIFGILDEKLGFWSKFVRLGFSERLRKFGQVGVIRTVLELFPSSGFAQDPCIVFSLARHYGVFFLPNKESCHNYCYCRIGGHWTWSRVRSRFGCQWWSRKPYRATEFFNELINIFIFHSIVDFINHFND